MPLSWNEIKDRALSFSKEWAETHNEEADAKPFLDAFFSVFGITRKKIATFEHRVKKLDTHDGYIDLFWKGTFLVEMKSKGKNLDKAYTQAREYLQTVPIHELPQYILICDFQNFRLYDYEKDAGYQFKLTDLVNNVQHFGFIAGYIKREFKEQDPVNIKAANLMGKLHDRLKDIGYTGHPLELYLVRLLFCLFAEDTTIFNKGAFYEFINTRTAEDGSDLAARLSELFFVLNTPEDKRLKYLDESLKVFPYVNGKLFEETLPPAAFDASMRLTLLECCTLDWGTISPAIFGSMFQSVMNPVERRNLGAHYTSEKNILKLIKPLFLDGLWQEFESIKGNRNRLPEFHKKISLLKFLDPACGCGNFLVITYRELRLLEMEILRAMNKTGQGFLNVSEIIWLDVDMMHGIEYEEFPAQIAQVAMWLIDHQMNMAISTEFGQYFARLPLKKAAKIIHGNALQIDWGSIVSKEQLSYILGNPPFIGYAWQSKEQKNDLEKTFAELKGAGVLDYVTAWYIKAAQYINGTKIKVAFVSTNSITQGEQVGILWGILFSKYNIKIHFAHRTFSWSNEAKSNAGVHVVIIGFANFDISEKLLYVYHDVKGEPLEIKVKNINPYLVAAKDILIHKRNTPICNVPEINRGSDAIDAKKEPINDLEISESVVTAYSNWISTFLEVNPASTNLETGMPISKLYYWTEDAKNYFYKWQAENAKKVNENANTLKGEILNKFDIHFVRLALILQLMENYGGICVELKAVIGAEKLCAYYIESAMNVLNVLDNSSLVVFLPLNKQKLYNDLPTDFRTAEAIEFGKKYEVNERALKEFLKNRELFERKAHGSYSKKEK